jgi:hypothetical protein
MSIQPSVGAGSSNISQTAVFQPELAATMTGAFALIGTLLASPVILIFDNQGTASVQIAIGPSSSTGPAPSTVWRTFTGGEAMILDLRANHGIAPNFTISAGTSFWGNGASGTFSISYLSATP